MAFLLPLEIIHICTFHTLIMTTILQSVEAENQSAIILAIPGMADAGEWWRSCVDTRVIIPARRVSVCQPLCSDTAGMQPTNQPTGHNIYFATIAILISSLLFSSQYLGKSDGCGLAAWLPAWLRFVTLTYSQKEKMVTYAVADRQWKNNYYHLAHYLPRTNHRPLPESMVLFVACGNFISRLNGVN